MGPEIFATYFSTMASVQVHLPDGWPRPAAPAGVHGAHQHEPAGQAYAPRGAGDGDFPVLDGLAQHLHGILAELRQLVQEEHPVVGQGYLPRPREGPASRQGHGGDGVVGAPEGTAQEEGVLSVGHTRHGPDLGGLQGLPPGHVRQDGGQAAGQHGLSRPRRTDEQDVVSPGGGDLQCPLHVLLPHDLGEVGAGIRPRLRRPGGGGGNFFPVSEVGQKLLHGLHGVDGQALGQRGLGGVFRRDVELLHARPGGGHGHGEHPGDGAQGAGQGQLPHEGGPFVRGIDVALGGQDAQEDGEVVDGALLPQGGGGQVDGDPGDGEFGPAALDGRTDSFS